MINDRHSEAGRSEEDGRSNPQPEPTHKVCGACGELLPVDSFYRTSTSGRLDSYCKDCRRDHSRQVRMKTRLESQAPDNKPERPLITQTQDRTLRMALVLQARQVVLDRIINKRRRELEEEYRRLFPNT